MEVSTLEMVLFSGLAFSSDGRRDLSSGRFSAISWTVYMNYKQHISLTMFILNDIPRIKYMVLLKVERAFR
jgi:hypothetical protein